MRCPIRLIINSFLFFVIHFSSTQVVWASTELTEHERTFVQSAIVYSIEHSDYYQSTKKTCQALAEDRINPVHCEILQETLTLEDIDLEFKTGHLSKNNNDVIAIAMFHLEGNIGNIKKHLFVFLRQDDGSLKPPHHIALPGFVRGIEDFDIKNGVIMVSILELGEQDDLWSPSIKKALQYGYDIENERIIELK